MKLILTILSFFYLISANAQWINIKSIPKPLSKHTVTVYNGKIYVFGNKYTFAYDPGADSWQTLDTITKIGDYKSAVTVKDKIYITGDKNTLIFNPQTNDYDTLKPEMPEILMYSTAVAFNNKLYVFGGYSGTNFLNTVLVYNPDSNKWAYKSKMYYARRLPCAAVADGKIYITGGFANDVLSINEVYNPSTDQWDEKEQLPSRRYQHAQGKIVIKGSEKIFIAGGYNDIELNDFHIYEPLNDKWYKLKDMNEYRYRFGAVSINNCVYVFGGFNSSGFDRATAEKICINSLGGSNGVVSSNQILFPNPSSGILNINSPDNNFNLEIFDINCKKSIFNINSNKQIDLSALPKGIYFYNLQKNNKIYKGKIILN